jgi:NO-binding membrane sensor protein with MHYT domain
MCQARASISFNAVLVWVLLASLTFGFCSIWSLHFVATLAYELDISIGINTALTILSSALAVVFTFAALGSDLLWEVYRRERKRTNGKHRRRKLPNGLGSRPRGQASDLDSRPLLTQSEDLDDFSPGPTSGPNPFELEGVEVEDSAPVPENHQFPPSLARQNSTGSTSTRKISTLPVLGSSNHSLIRHSDDNQELGNADSTTDFTDSGDHSTSGRSSSLLGSSSTSTFALSSIVNIAYLTTSPAKNIFFLTGETLHLGCTWKNITKGFVWSLAITSMHYAGINALRIPSGYCTLNYAFVALSGVISWLVCIVGCILMSQMETHLGQQFLFSIAATTGVAAMHFTGKSLRPPSDVLILTPPRNGSCNILD